MELFLWKMKNEIVVFNIYRNTESQKKTLRFVSQQQYYKADLDHNFLSPHFHWSDGLPVLYYALLPNVCNWYTILLLSSLYANSRLFFWICDITFASTLLCIYMSTHFFVSIEMIIFFFFFFTEYNVTMHK